ncbi:putative histone-lysine N-methyltransferase [Medicago truncatula]|uniref:Putative histone-lysine N-methyltransferase n=1 Tax=Medicago truncatula TaxID=3880 RepID=A0A396H701_MEDTR|nr:putative histone-lysine N-methyltransferase [Medicago truncatula]
MLVISKNESLPIGGNILFSRMNRPPCTFYSPDHQVLGEEDRSNKPVRTIRMPSINRLPPYTSWIHLARTVFDEHGLTEEVLSIVKDVIGGTSSEIQERYKNIKEKDQNDEDRRESESQTDTFLNKSLSVSLDTFDNFYCRRCMIFDCPLHGCSQKIIYPAEKQPVWQEPEGPKEPCGEHCYLHNKDVTISNCMRGLNLDANNDEKNDMDERKSKHLSDSIEGQAEEESIPSDWKLLEKELYLKGIEMFGRNSCLIAKNILFMMKTCTEVARYMYAEESIPHGSMGENGQSNAMRIVSTIIHFISPSPLCFFLVQVLNCPYHIL